ncbi:MAG: cyclic nucleotide-binding domain-containing protein [Thermotogaceae bacterium]|jgi:hypothetical protein|nr:cyclic nucleotide-binding domain-containing protein [Mesotoga sp.]MDI9375106.1 cyclic nucleotide-binding domain-containing protein [Thermotogota bacterium]NLX33594.1 cyclic nucleotide-binding domain-containing protein [Thermotogaceae bacterium]MDD4039635.1 cyclic nucleotide-binding domain-containing protein [Mesotoga sp.]MDD4477783.1 cyclic nucleotide-binding domain-containing protein [Mesotoga sp.]
MAGELADPITITGCNHSGDLFTIGYSSVLVGSKEELREYLVAKPERLKRVFDSVRQEISACERYRDMDFEDYMKKLIQAKQRWLDEFPPLLFGEKSLYRKGVKLIERGEFAEAEEVLKFYISHYENSPLTWPAMIFYAVSCIYNRKVEVSLKTIVQIMSGANNELSFLARKMVCYLELLETSYRLITKGPGYGKDFFNHFADLLSDRSSRARGDTVIFEEGNKSNNVVFLLEGNLKFLKTSRSRTSLLFTIDAPDSVGEIHAFTGGSWDTTVVAGDDSRFAVLGDEEFFDILIEKFPPEGFRLLEYLLGYSREMRGY